MLRPEDHTRARRRRTAHDRDLDATIPILLPDVDAVLVPQKPGLGMVARTALDGALAEWRIRPADDELEGDMHLGLPARPWREGFGWDQIHDAELMTR